METYNTVIKLRKSRNPFSKKYKTLEFSDFKLEHIVSCLGAKAALEWGGNFIRFIAKRGSNEVEVIWIYRPQTCLLINPGFEIAGKKFRLEMLNSSTLNKKLKPDELVVSQID